MWCCALLCIVLAFTSCNGELYTALADMEELFETEAVLMKTLEGYITAQENKIASLRRHLSEFDREHEEASQDIQSYLSNPISAFMLVKRLTTGWKQVESRMVDETGADFIENITAYHQTLKFPTDEDLNGAAVALMRLQDTYKLDTSSVARGLLNGVQYPTELTSSDCYELGRQSYNNGDFYHTVLWMTEALTRHDEEVNSTTSKDVILDYLAFSTYKEGNVHSALALTEQLLEIVPSHQRALGNKAHFLADMQKKTVHNRRGDDGIEDLAELKRKGERGIENFAERDVYEMLCRGEIKVDRNIAARLKCRYVHNGIAFLRLAPLKQEQAYLKPHIVLYHDVIYDSEMNIIKKLARPRFQRATVQNYKTGELETANYRISKSAWLLDEEHRLVRSVNQRAADIASLNVATAEQLQVVNYGIGGHYEPHFDFARKDEEGAFKGLGTGNRIATVLFYMSDVQQGGATVFPHLKVALFPRKGTAAFWFNLHEDGEGDLLTRHAACPVLSGTKWVSNKWFHERGQEFVRPCGTRRDSLDKPCEELTRGQIKCQHRK